MSIDFDVKEWAAKMDEIDNAEYLTVAWHKIEIAPKDWSDVLLHVPDLSSDFRTVCEGYYDASEALWTSAMFGVVVPTHWMPLPPPPQNDTKE